MPKTVPWAFAAVTLGVFAAGCGPTPAAPTAAVTPYHGPVLTNAAWGPVFQAPGRYIGARIRVTGQITERVPDSHPPLFQVYLDPVTPANPIAAFGLARYAAGSYVALSGVITATRTFHNALGYPVLAPIVRVTSSERITRDDAVDPTLAVTSPAVSARQNGLTLTVSQVQFAAQATRIFLTAVNRSATAVTVDDTGARLTQGGQSLALRTGSPDIHAFPITIAGGRTAHSEIVFNRSRLGGPALALQIPVSGNSYRLNWHDFSFSLAVPAHPPA
ncbi:MAG: hypothetical protein M0Z53_04520 [Thermaerobacter sp.]|nr:hypothetical protein [Thermaerobacter sp.]